MKRVLATREGLINKPTATGHIIQPDSWFAALPSTHALRRVIRIYREDGAPGQVDTRGLTAPVLDVGPWNEHDEMYVFGEARPLSETGISVSGEGTNKSGIDLSDLLWTTLGFDLTDGPQWVYWDWA